MSPEDLKEANRLFWIVKGHLIPQVWSEREIQRVYESYFARIWGNHEAVYHEDGFEQAWQERMKNGSPTKIL
jgi:hypothetical protein